MKINPDPASLTLVIGYLWTSVQNVMGTMSARDLIGTARHSSPEILLDAFHSAAEKSNLRAYFGCFSRGNSVFLGTAKEERWTAEQFFYYARPVFEARQGWTYYPIPGSRFIEYFFASTVSGEEEDDQQQSMFCTFDELLDASSRGAFQLSTVRGSGSLVFNPETKCWFVASYHMTFPIPNECVDKVCQPILEFEKEAATENADRAAEELLAELNLDEEHVAQSKHKNKSSKKKGKGKK